MVRKPRKTGRVDRFLNALLTCAVIALALAYIAKFGGPELLKFYIRSGMGDCVKIPILCKKPSESLSGPGADPVSLIPLVPAEFPSMNVGIPEGFLGVEEKIRKVYYRSSSRGSRTYRSGLYAPARRQSGAVIYLLYRPPGFFVELFPRLKQQGVTTDYEFIRRAMHASLNDVSSIADAFFVIIKGVFIPDLGNQHEVTMAAFELGDKRGFINYNLSAEGHFFDCNIIDAAGHFFKLYIKDSDGAVGIEDALAVISTVRPGAGAVRAD